MSIDDLSYDNSFIKCRLTGTACNVACSKFKFDEVCSYSVYECRCIYPGKLWYFIKVVQDKILDERDFQYVIHTGKSLRNDQNDNDAFSNYNDVKEYSTVVKVDETQDGKVIDKDVIHQNIKNIYDNYTDDARNQHINNVTNILKNDKTAPKTTFNKILDAACDKDFYKKMNSIVFLDMICDYILKGENGADSSKISIDDIEQIFLYFFFVHTPVKGDFPFNQFIVEDKMVKLIEKSKSLDITHPCKWTSERIDKVLNECDPYYRIIWFDNEYYSWYLYVFIHADIDHKYDFNNVSSLCIMTKYILNFILNKLCFFYGSNYIIVNYYKSENVYNRLIIILSMLKLIYEKYSKNPFKSLFLKEQIHNIYLLKKELVKTDEFRDLKNMVGDVVDIDSKFKYLVEKDVLEHIKFDKFVSINI